MERVEEKKRGGSAREKGNESERKRDGDEEIYIARERKREREGRGERRMERGRKERVSDIDMHGEYRTQEPA